MLFSLSATAPTMPANYDYKRLVGWFKRVSATIVPFTTYELPGGGIEMAWNTPTLDVNLTSTLTTTRRTDAIKVPLNFSVVANIGVSVYDGAAAFSALICCPDQTDAAPSATSLQLANVFQASATGGNGSGITRMWVRTSSTGTIAARADLATVDAYLVSTIGFQWGRR